MTGGNGGFTKAILQSRTAMRLSLGLVARLSELALAHDATCPPLPNELRSSYAITTIGVYVSVYMMRMEDNGDFVSDLSSLPLTSARDLLLERQYRATARPVPIRLLTPEDRKYWSCATASHQPPALEATRL